MLLPLSSSLPSIADSEDGILSKQLMLADTNAEYNRIAFSQYDDYSDISSPSPATTLREPLKTITFHPEVSVRFIRPRLNTARSSFSDFFGSFKCPDSPLCEDSTQTLKESSPHSGDEEFDRFYRTMESHNYQIPTPPARSRRLSFDDGLDIESRHRGNRPRSISCDDHFFQ